MSMRPVPPPPEEYMRYTSATRTVIMAAVMLGVLMQMIDSSIVNVAIPTMQGNLGATLDQISWVATGYILANVIVLPMTGWLSAAFGRRRYLAGSMMIFTAASVLCGMSRSLNLLVAARIVQGVGGAALVSTAQATMMEIYPRHQLGMVQAIYGLGVMVGPAVGPTLGGWIVDNLSWPWIFYINLPIGIVAATVTLLYMRDSLHEAKGRIRIDAMGIFLLAVGLGSLQTLLEKGTREGWFDSELICWLTGAAVIGIVAFVSWELRVAHPVVNLRILRHRGFSAGTAFGTVLGFGLYGGIFVLPVFLQHIRGYTAMQTGLIMLPGALSAGMIMPFVGALVSRLPPRGLTAVGVLGAAASMFMFRNLTMNTNWEHLLWPMIVRGASMGLIWVPLTLATLIGLRGREIAEGTALFNVFRQLGGSAGIAFLSTFLGHRTDFHFARLSERANVYNPAFRLWVGRLQGAMAARGAAAGVAQLQAISLVRRIVLGQSAVLSYQDIFLLMGFVFLATMPLLLLFEKGRAPMGRPGAPAGK